MMPAWCPALMDTKNIKTLSVYVCRLKSYENKVNWDFPLGARCSNSLFNASFQIWFGFFTVVLFWDKVAWRQRKFNETGSY